MKNYKVSTLLGLSVLLVTPLTLPGQTPTGRDHDLLQARLIKVRRMAEAWVNDPVELHVYDGNSYRGKFLSLNGGKFRLDVGDKVREIPLGNVQKVVLKRKPGDLLFVGLMTAGVAALLAGAGSLTSDASGGQMVGISIAGAAIGFTFGWKTLFQDRIIRLD